jgi:hypothetical protein
MFRFTIRDVLWLTVVAALGVGWWVDRSSLAVDAAENRQLKERLGPLHGDAEANAEREWAEFQEWYRLKHSD